MKKQIKEEEEEKEKEEEEEQEEEKGAVLKTFVSTSPTMRVHQQLKHADLTLQVCLDYLYVYLCTIRSP